jgi:hypothetical protein
MYVMVPERNLKNKITGLAISFVLIYFFFMFWLLQACLPIDLILILLRFYPRWQGGRSCYYFNSGAML